MRAWKLPILVVAVLLAGAAPAAAEGYYMALHGGANFTHDGAVDDYFFFEPDQIGHSAFESGYGFGGAFGYKSPDWRVELEATYRRNGLEKIEWDVFGKDGTFDTDGDISSLAFLINAFWDIPVGPAVIPYLGAGIGLAYVDFDGLFDADGPLFDESEVGLAAQLGLGVGFPLGEAITLSMDYRFFFVGFLEPTVDASQPGIGGQSLGFEYTNSTLWLGLRYEF